MILLRMAKVTRFTSIKNYLVILIVCNILISSIFLLKNSKSEEDIAEWTFMVYMAGDNSLDNAGLKMPLDDINEMETAGSTDKVNIIVLCDRKRDDDAIYKIKKDKEGYTPNEGSNENLDWDTPVSEKLDDNYEVIPKDGELNMDEPSTLINFIKWTMENYPAKHYLLDLWNHGKGWRWVCSDNSKYLDIEDLKTALSKIGKKKIDIIGFDACSMGLLEVFYQIKDYGRYVIASEEEWPEDGWAYNDFLPKLVNNPLMSPEELAKNIVEDSVEAYRGQTELPITHSAVDLNEIKNVVNSIEELSQSLMDSYPYFGNEIKNIRTELKVFKDNAVDLYYFAELILKNGTKKLRILAKELINAIDKAVVAEEHFTEDKNEAAENANGIAIYFPAYKANFENNYKNLNFSKNSIWDEFLENYYKIQTKKNANFKKINYKTLDSNNDKIPDSIKIEYESASNVESVNVTIDIYDSKNKLVKSFFDNYSVNEKTKLRNKTFTNKKFGNDTYYVCIYLRNRDGLQDYREFECFLEKCDIELSCEDNKHIIKPGGRAKYIIKIKNNGNMDRNPYDTVHLQFFGLPDNWNASFDDDNDTNTEFNNFTDVKTNSYKYVTLVVETAFSSENGIYNITIIAISENSIENSSVVISTIISQRYRVNLSIENEKNVVKKVKPGKIIKLTLTLVNEGNFNDTIYLDLEGEKRSWTQFLDTPVYRLEPGDLVEVNLSIEIPKDAKKGEYNIKVIATSKNSNSRDSVNVILDVDEKVIFGLKPLYLFLYIFAIFFFLTLFLIFFKRKTNKNSKNKLS